MIKDYSIEIGPKVKVVIDKRSEARVINFPFEFPDGSDGVIIVCKMTKLDWKPNEEIERVNINFKKNENKTN